ncbi:hypothetical protein DFJ74DRAFT_503984 [Hyaloraphidium curvatum]|nr:hypothetical protein DFJ74DRAFT_503984 [Hyaloraphidium curvatum]
MLVGPGRLLQTRSTKDSPRVVFHAPDLRRQQSRKFPSFFVLICDWRGRAAPRRGGVWPGATSISGTSCPAIRACRRRRPGLARFCDLWVASCGLRGLPRPRRSVQPALGPGRQNLSPDFAHGRSRARSLRPRALHRVLISSFPDSDHGRGRRGRSRPARPGCCSARGHQRGASGGADVRHLGLFRRDVRQDPRFWTSGWLSTLPENGEPNAGCRLNSRGSSRPRPGTRGDPPGSRMSPRARWSTLSITRAALATMLRPRLWVCAWP